MTDTANAVQARIIAETVARAAIEEYVRENPPKAEMPPHMKWIGSIGGAVLVALIVGMCSWMAATLSDLTKTVARIDERQQVTADDRREMKERLNRIDERIGRLETGGVK